MTDIANPEDIDFYYAPPNGWTCFHCGETFHKEGAARDHFGRTEMSDPACQIKTGEEMGLLMALRKAEDEIQSLRHDMEKLNTDSWLLGNIKSDFIRYFGKGSSQSVYDIWRSLEETMFARDEAHKIIEMMGEESPHYLQACKRYTEAVLSDPNSKHACLLHEADMHRLDVPDSLQARGIGA